MLYCNYSLALYSASEVLTEIRGLHGDVGWGIYIEEIEFVIEDTKSGSSRILGLYPPLLVGLCLPDSGPSRPLGKWQS
jgi:hypothetical protein